MHKVKTIGDAYIVCCGAFVCTEQQQEAAKRIVNMGMSMQYIVSQKAITSAGKERASTAAGASGGGGGARGGKAAAQVEPESAPSPFRVLLFSLCLIAVPTAALIGQIAAVSDEIRQCPTDAGPLPMCDRDAGATPTAAC